VSSLGIWQTVEFLLCAGVTCYFLGLSRRWKDSVVLICLGLLFFIVPASIVAAIALRGYPIVEIVLLGKAGVTFAVPLGIGFGFVLSALGPLLRSGDLRD